MSRRLIPVLQLASHFSLPSRLVVFNTLTQKKEPFVSLRPSKVQMFVCGPTVQDYIHLGHARTYIFYDVVARYLTRLGYKVRFVLNITDVDDRITDEANRTGATPSALARKYSRYFVEDMAKLKADTICRFEPVSKFVDKMIDQISLLIRKRHAYVVNGWVYFDVSTFPNFGKLSHQSSSELSLRPLELSVRKRDILDFALWHPETLVEGKWVSPWGTGSPSWHIQDTQTFRKVLGPHRTCQHQGREDVQVKGERLHCQGRPAHLLGGPAQNVPLEPPLQNGHGPSGNRLRGENLQSTQENDRQVQASCGGRI